MEPPSGTFFRSPLGTIHLTADSSGLTGLSFASGPISDASAARCRREGEDLPVFEQTKRWLALYFSGKQADFTIPLHFTGTAFQNDVWKILCSVPYGKTSTYGMIAKELAAQKGIARMSAQAVGGAIGRNKISILVPCHRIVGSDGNLRGYAWGLERKIALLTLEHAF